MSKENGIIFLEEPRMGQPLDMMRFGKKITTDPVKKIIRNNSEGTIKIVTASGFTCVGKVDEMQAPEEPEIVVTENDKQEQASVQSASGTQEALIIEPDTEKNSDEPEIVIPDNLFKSSSEPVTMNWRKEDSEVIASMFNKDVEKAEENIRLSADGEIIVEDIEDSADDIISEKPQKKTKKSSDEEINEYLKRAKNVNYSADTDDVDEPATSIKNDEEDEPDVVVSVPPSSDTEIIPDEYEEESFVNKDTEKPWLRKTHAFKIKINKKRMRRYLMMALKVSVVAIIVFLLGYYVIREPVIKLWDAHNTNTAYNVYLTELNKKDNKYISSVVTHIELDKNDHLVTLVMHTDTWIKMAQEDRSDFLVDSQAIWRSLLESHHVSPQFAKLAIVNEKRIAMARAFYTGAFIFKDEEVLVQSGYDPDEYRENLLKKDLK